jgi:hypothetical protein
MEKQNSAEFGPNRIVWHLSKLRALIGGMGYAHMATWMNANRANYPKFVYHAAAWCVGTIFAVLAIRTVSAAGGDIAEEIVLQVATAVTAVITCVIIASAARNIHRAFVEPPVTPWAEPKQLPAETAWQPPSIAPDIIVALLPGEGMADFANRAILMAGEATNAIWVAIIQPKGGCAIYRGPNLSPRFFARGAEPFVGLLPDGQKWPEGLSYEKETADEYRHYCDWFAFYFSKWTPEEKLIADTDHAGKTFLDTMTETAKAVTVVFSLLLLCLPAFGQSKTRQVDEALGTRIREIPQAGERVEYRFAEKGKEMVYTRTGDGRSEYTDLLKKTKGLVTFNDQGGDLIAVLKNGEVVAKADNVERVNATPSRPDRNAAYLPENNTSDPVRPRGALPTADEIAGTPRTDQVYLPDSSEVAETLDGVKKKINYRKTELWHTVEPIWEFVMWAFFSVIPIAICFGGLFRYVSQTARNEGFYGLSGIGLIIRRAHEAASGWTLAICWVVSIVLLIDVFMWFVYMDWPIWAILLVWFPVLWVAKKLTNWVTPNPPTGSGAWEQSSATFPTLPTGRR